VVDGRIAQLEQLTEQQRYLEVMDLAPSLLTERSRGLRAYGHFFLGQALNRLFRPEEAIDHLVRARAFFEALGGQPRLVERLEEGSSSDEVVDCLFRPEQPVQRLAKEEVPVGAKATRALGEERGREVHDLQVPLLLGELLELSDTTVDHDLSPRTAPTGPRRPGRRGFAGRRPGIPPSVRAYQPRPGW